MKQLTTKLPKALKTVITVNKSLFYYSKVYTHHYSNLTLPVIMFSILKLRFMFMFMVNKKTSKSNQIGFVG